MGHHAHAEAQGSPPSFLRPPLEGVTFYYLKLPGAENTLINRFALVGIASGPPGGPLASFPGIATHTYFRHEPSPPFLPPPPTGIDRAMERLHKAFLQWERDYDSLDIGPYLGFP